MALSKSTRILILLGIDSAFFFLELIVGYSVHSLALVADSFHMLNDVLSLCVGLWAVRVAQSKKRSKMYTYGWQRAETLGALVNGVFLVALCLSIFLEAIQRFVQPQEVSHPKLVLIVGCCGLASNILGLFLFHEHGHGHGHSHGEDVHNLPHSHSDLGVVEERLGARNTEVDEDTDDDIASEHGNVADVLPQSTVGLWPRTRSRSKSAPKATRERDDVSEAPTVIRRCPSSVAKRTTRSVSVHSRSNSRTYSSLSDMYIHPASFRNEIIAASRLEEVESTSGTDADSEGCAVDHDTLQPSETSPLLRGNGTGHGPHHSNSKDRPSLRSERATNGNPSNHSSHRHDDSKHNRKQGGHSHGDLNMRGVFLHVLGDALGNVGVIASALVIWLTKFTWRFYADPAISLIITVIILASAIPLCKAASRILLQAVPAGINVDDIKYDIRNLPGVVSCHHIHVWQLSDTKLVASLHVQVGFDFKGEGSACYMALARDIRRCLHDYGIHSSTIQPEFCLDPSHVHAEVVQDAGISNIGGTDGPASHNGTPRVNSLGSRVGSQAASLHSEPTCLLDCSDACARSKQCCVIDDEGTEEPGNGRRSS